METTTGQISEQFMELLQGFIRLRPNLIFPEEVTHFKKQMETLRSSGLAASGDHRYLFRILIILAHSPNPPTMGELSSDLGIPLSSTTRIVDWLVNAGFVERTNDPNDRRVVRVQMSRMGKQFFQSLSGFIKQRINHLLDNFSPLEQQQLLQLMTKLFNSLAAEK